MNEKAGGEFCVKIPICEEGLKATMELKKRGVKVLMTAIFTPAQALIAVKVGTAAMGLSFSAILLSYPMVAVITILFVLSMIEIILGIKLYKMVLLAKTLKTQAAQ